MLNLYNTATRQKEEFKPFEEGKVSMYTCGPTVYHFAHIGNLRTYIMEDVLEKYLRYSGYDVKRIIRIGSCGSYKEDVKVRDVIIAVGSSTNSSWADHYKLSGSYSAIATYDLVEKAVASAKARNVRYHVGQVLASDIFYAPYGEEWKKWAQMGVLGVEMESYALYCNAAFLGKEALTILTVSDSFVSPEITTAEERQTSFTQMMEIALELI